MILRSWLACIFGRLTTSQVRIGRKHRKAGRLAAATHVEYLESKALLAGTFTMNQAGQTFTTNEEATHYPYPAWNRPSGTGIGVTVSFTDTQTLSGGGPATKNADIQIIAGNPGNAFAVNPATGVVSIFNPAEIDQSVNPTFTLTFQQTDNVPSTATGTLTISLNAVYQPPVIPQFPYQNDTFASISPPSAKSGPTEIQPDANHLQADTGDDITSNTNLNINALDFKPTGTGKNLFRVKENSASGTVVGQVYAGTPDKNQNDQYHSTLTYTFQGTVPGFDSADPAIAIDPFSGVIRIIDPAFFNYEALRTANVAEGNLGEGVLFSDGNGGTAYVPDVTIQVQVRVTDINSAGIPRNFSQTAQPGGGVSDSFIYIRVLDVGEIAPDVSRATTNLTLNEGVLGGDAVVPTASVIGTSAGFFQMVNGVPNTFSALLPGLQNPDPTGNSVRVAKPASVLGLSTIEQQQRYSYTVAPGTKGFTIDINTGEVTVTDPTILDFEQGTDFTLQIIVTSDNQAADFLTAVQDCAPLSTVASLHIHINDINEQSYVFSPSTAGGNKPFSIPEGSLDGTVVGTSTIFPTTFNVVGGSYQMVAHTAQPNTIAVFDDDFNQPNGKGKPTYSITSGNSITVGGTTYNQGIFAIDPNTGTITVQNQTPLTNAQVLDYLNQKIFQLTIQVVDRGDLSTAGSASVEIDLNPVDTTPPNVIAGFATIREYTGISAFDPTNGAVVGQVTASAGQSDFSIASYAITSGNSVTIGASTFVPFAINANTGQITVNNVNGLNYEYQSVFTLGIKVTDNGSPVPLSATSTFTITLLNQNDPIKFDPSNAFTYSINENSPNGTLVTTLQTKDEDNLNTVIQSQFFTINGGDTNGAFAIDSQGNVTVANTAALDFETTPNFTISLTVTDTGVPSTSDTHTIVISLNNVNDAPFMPNSSFTINEHSLAGTAANSVPGGKTNALGASDQDQGQTLSFAITGGNASGAFAIDPVTGVITVTDPGLIDFSTKSSYPLTVTATDDGVNFQGPPNFAPLSSSGTVTINLNNKAEPQLSAQNFSIDENATAISPAFNASPATWQMVTTNDPATPFTYSIIGGNSNTGNGQNNAFAIDPVTGILSINNPAAFDYETLPGHKFQLKVLVIDSSGATAALDLGDTAIETITLNDKNEAPVLSNIEASTLNYNESTPPVYSPNNITAVTQTLQATDPDAGDMASGATVQITGNYQNGQDKLIFTNTANIIGTLNPLGDTMTLTGIDTYANYQAALRAVKYQDTSDNPVTNLRTVSYQISDLAGLPSNIVTRKINVVPVNDPPVLPSIETTTLTYTENSTTTNVSSIITVQDPDNANVQGATIQITGNYINGEDTLTFTNTATITGSWNAATGTLTLTGSDTVANYSAALEAVDYVNLSNNPNTTLTRTVSFTATDGSLSSNTLSRNIKITAVNDPPALINLETTTLSYVEKATTPITSTIVATDPDSTNASGATITITGNFVAAEDTLVYNGPASLVFGHVPGSNAWTLTGVASFTTYRTALRAVEYHNTSSNPNTAVRTVSFTITDDGNLTSPAVSRKISITRVNDAPVLTPTNSTLSYTEGTGAKAINPAIVVTDVDNATLANGTITITNFNPAEDVLGFVPTAATGNIIVQSNVGGVLVLTSPAPNATLAQWQAAFRAVTYTNTSGNLAPPSRTVTFVADDGSAANNLSTAITTTINTTPIFPPVLAKSATLAYTEKNTATPINTVLTVSDPGTATLASATIKITNFVAGQDILGFVNNGSSMGNVAISSNANGTLVLTSAGSTATLAQWQAALQAVTYRNSSSNPSTATRNVTYQVSNGKPVNALSNVLTSSITLTAVNDAPVLSGIESTVRNYVEKSTNANITSTLTVTDVDSTNMGGATVQITGNYQSAEDSLQFANTSNITGSFDSLTGKLTLTGVDTIANYITALQSVDFFDSSNNPVTLQRTITFTVSDNAGAVSNAVTRGIKIVPVDNAPSLSGIEANPLNYIENTPPNYATNNATIVSQTVQATDPDSVNMSGATIQITGNYLNGQDTLVFTNTAKITGSWNSSTGTLTLTGIDTLANYTAALESVAYKNLQDAPNTATRTVTYTVLDDAGLASNQVSRDINITPVNDPPLVTSQDLTALAYTENGAAKLIMPNILVTDPDSNNLQSATVRISGNYNPVTDRLGYSNIGNITGSWNPANGTLTFSGVDSVSNYRTALRSVSFFNHNDGTVPPTKVVSFNVTDDSGLKGNTVSRTINVSVVPDASILSNIETTSHIYKAKDQYTPPTPVTSSLVITDYDSAFLNGATIKIVGNIPGQDRLGFSAAGTAITGSLDTSTGTLTLSGHDTVAHYQAALRSVVYYNVSSTPSTAARSISFTVTDDTNLTSNKVSRSLTIVTTNTPPTLSLNASGPLQYTEKDAATPIVPNLTITDPDSPNMQGAIIKITSNYQPSEDRLAFTTSGNLIKGTFDVTTGTLTLTGGDTLADYQAALRNVTYVNLSNNPSTLTRSVNFVVNDGLNPSGAINARSITVSPVNDPPVVAVNSGALSYTPSNGAVVLLPSLTVSDADSANLASASVQITFNYQRGNDVLTFKNTTKIIGVFDASTGTMKLTGTDTVANYRAALRSIMYQFNGTPITSTKIVTITASDGSAVSSPVTRNINIS